MYTIETAKGNYICIDFDGNVFVGTQPSTLFTFQSDAIATLNKHHAQRFPGAKVVWVEVHFD